MTSQVAIFNLNGIAVASDTVATTSTESGKKTTNNAEKIYPLGGKHLVVGLHYGGTRLNDLHHKFHFNRWVESLTKPLDYLQDYVDSYVEWTSKNKLHSSQSEEIEVESILKDHFDEIVRRTQKDFERETPENHWEFVFERLAFHAKAGLEHLKNLPRMNGITLESANSTLSQMKFDIRQLFARSTSNSWIFESHPKIPAPITRVLSQSAPLALVADQEIFWDSFLAFVGYGAKDNFGGVITIQCRSIIDGKLVYSANEISRVQPGTQESNIHTFAQYDAIGSFLQGYNSDIISGIRWAIVNKGRDVLPKSVTDEKLSELSEAVYEYIDGHSWRHYVKPMLNHISGMSLFGLSELAKTLVGLQATASEANNGPVSVGGLIEVLTIDRMNGVEWRSKLP